MANDLRIFVQLTWLPWRRVPRGTVRVWLVPIALRMLWDVVRTARVTREGWRLVLHLTLPGDEG